MTHIVVQIKYNSLEACIFLDWNHFLRDPSSSSPIRFSTRGLINFTSTFYNDFALNILERTSPHYRSGVSQHLSAMNAIKNYSLLYF
jgi:hypothetical protein